MTDSPRWCAICEKYGDHHSDRHFAFGSEPWEDHGPDSHDCKLEPFCNGDPECEYAKCDACGAPNGKCVCDILYMRAHDK